MDSYYTPIEIAKEMVNAVKDLKPDLIADFAVGNGALLKVANEYWTNAKFIANDIDPKVVRDLKADYPKWETSSRNFFDSSLVSSCRVLSEVKKKVSLILLNPPFSCKGGTVKNIEINGQEIRCSNAMAFLIKAIDFLSEEGQLVAVLPISTLFNEKDKDAWSIIKGMAKVKYHKEYYRKRFSKAIPNTAIVHIKLLSVKDRKKKLRLISSNSEISSSYITPDLGASVYVIRGNTPMFKWEHISDEQGIPFIHTSDLQYGRVQHSHRFVSCESKTIQGSMILIPRVGRPSLEKITHLEGENRVVLSDCVISILCENPEVTTKLYNVLRENWHILKTLYKGTCAPYITINNLVGLLCSWGYEAVAVKASVLNQLYYEQNFCGNLGLEYRAQ
jgi:hypothetical protein